MKNCQSCREHSARYNLTLTNLSGEVLDSVSLCLDCLKSAQVTDVLSPGAKELAPEPTT